VTALSDDEDSQPNVRPRQYPEHGPTLPPPEFAAPDEPTRPDIRSPLPQRPTLKLTAEQQQEIERQVYAHEHKRLAEALENIARVLPTLATKSDVATLDAGLKGAMAVSEAVGEQVTRLEGQLKLWLFGDDMRPGVAQGIDATSKLANDALTEAKGALHEAGLAAQSAREALRLNRLVYDKVMHPQADDEQLAAEASSHKQ
jgi:hypothetical protein